MGPFSRVSVAAFLSAVMPFASAVAADDPPPVKPAASADASSKSAGKPPFIVHNPDGTFTVQLVPAGALMFRAKRCLKPAFRPVKFGRQ